jgi:dTDP-4-dehydrorhamnose reductase
VHRARPNLPRDQDAGFGYLVASLATSLHARKRFTLWDGPGLNQIATPTLASDAARLVWRALEREATGVLHCCGGEHTDRVKLARRAIEIFELDGDLLDVSPPPAAVLSGEAVPRDTRLDAAATAQALGLELPDLTTTLARLRCEVDDAWGKAGPAPDEEVRAWRA